MKYSYPKSLKELQNSIPRKLIIEQLIDDYDVFEYDEITIDHKEYIGKVSWNEIKDFVAEINRYFEKNNIDFHSEFMMDECDAIPYILIFRCE